jgi:hypothetical protein
VRQASFAVVALFVPIVDWYLVAPVAALFGWTRRAFMLLCCWAMLLLAVLAAAGGLESTAATRAAWGISWLAAAAIGFRLAGRTGGPGPLARLSRRYASVLAAALPGRDPRELIVLCERRIGRSVDAAARLRVQTPSGARTHALALAGGHVWWLELHPWRMRAGAIIAYRPLDGLAAHTERRRAGRHRVELSWPSAGELFVGTLYGPGADRLAGQLTAEQFARMHVHTRAPEDAR